MKISLLAVCLVLLVPQATAIQKPRITALSPRGVKFEVLDEGYDLVALHYSKNKKVPGVKAGDYNVDVYSKQGGYWVHENTGLTLHSGDYIDYWVYAVSSGMGQQLLNMEWRYSTAGVPTQRPATNAPVHTQAPYTQAPQTHAPVVNHVQTGNQQTNFGSQQQQTVRVAQQAASASNQAQSSQCTSYPCLIFEDNFDFINHNVWEHELTLGGGGNWEFEHYTNNRSNSYCKNGILYIKPTLTTDNYGDNFLESGSLDIWGAGPHDTCTGNSFYGCKRDGVPGRVINPIQSARLRSSRGFDVKYGKVEVEAKLPTGDWIWPAIWMLPTYDTYGMWPASGEIDIMESRGNLNYRDSKGEPAGVDHMGSTLHFGPNYNYDAWPKATASKNLRGGKTFGQSFNRYAVEWDESMIRFTVNDEEILKVVPPADGGFWKLGGWDKTGMENPWRHGTNMAPFDQEFYIILNVAVGGQHYFADDNVGPRRKPWRDDGANIATDFWRAKNEWYPTWNPLKNDGEDAAMQINYVRVWKMKA